MEAAQRDRASIVEEARFHGMVGESGAMRRVFAQIARIAPSPIPVLVLGETGTGKDMAARAIHEIAGLDGPLVVVSCAAIAPTLIESELFGHERGAFTGAARTRKGLVAEADGGTLFLDETGELPVTAQAKLLRVIESGEYRRLGSERPRLSRFRVIAATHRDLDGMVAEGLFRQDLLHRLGTARVVMPPLRERLDDLPLLVGESLRHLNEQREGRGPTELSREAMKMLRISRWPGNVRQLRHVVEAGAVAAVGSVVGPWDIAQFLPTESPVPATLNGTRTLAEIVAEAEERAIRRALRRTSGRRRAAADLLGISPATLRRKLANLAKSG